MVSGLLVKESSTKQIVKKNLKKKRKRKEEEVDLIKLKFRLKKSDHIL